MSNLADKKKKLRVVVLDDEPESVEHMVSLIEVTDGFELAFVSNSPWEVLGRLKEDAVHVLFLDMEMPTMHGLQLMQQLDFIKKINPLVAHLQVVVCTAHEHFAREAFDNRATDYLTKPVTFSRYMQAVNVVKERLLPMSPNVLDRANECLIMFSERGKAVARVNFNEIIVVEAQDDKSWVWINSTDYYETSEGLGDVLLRLPKSNFIKVHRSYAISLSHFQGIVGESGSKHKFVVLKGTDAKIPLGEQGNHPLFEMWLGENAVRGKKISKKR
ncbi:LytR/AlgR family response regulator transcription factor [Sphingobacterium corticibacterium]|nr:LytTR family DNA-binding domain-containing protein [Sphingobacterium corticibacterium]